MAHAIIYFGLVFILILHRDASAHPANIMGQDVNSRIVGGMDTNISEFNFLVQLRRLDTLCGCSLLNKDWCLTAAHCTYEFSPEEFYVVGGTSYIDGDDGIINSLYGFTVHPQYDPKTFNNDISLARMAEPMVGDSIGYIDMGQLTTPTTGLLEAAGWGLTSENGKVATVLQSIKIKLIDHKTCVTMYKKKSRVTNKMICAANLGKQDACQGDSGGPLTWKGKLVGVTSHGHGCGRAKYPGVYTNVSQFMSWVEESMLLWNIDPPENEENTESSENEENTESIDNGENTDSAESAEN